MSKETAPPAGCWRLLVGLPVLVLITRAEEPWQKFFVPLLPPHLSADAVMTLYGFSLLALMLVAWMAALKIVDLILGTKLYPYGSGEKLLSPTERARCRRRGLLTITGVAVADQAMKYAFGIAHPAVATTPPALSPDASIIVNSIGLLVFFFVWFRSEHRLESTALSLVVGGVVSGVFDQVTRKSAVVLQIHAFGLAPVFTVAEIAIIAGLALFLLSWFWEPKSKAQTSSAAQS